MTCTGGEDIFNTLEKKNQCKLGMDIGALPKLQEPKSIIRSDGIQFLWVEATEESTMETEAQHSKPENDAAVNAAFINSFIEITSSSKEEALFFLESHNWDLDAAVSTFLDNHAADALDAAAAAAAATATVARPLPPPDSPEFSPSQSPSRSRSPSPPASRAPYELRSRRARGDAEKKVDTRASGSRTRRIRTFSDLNRPAEEDSDSDSDELQEYYTGGEKRYVWSLIHQDLL